MRALVCSLAATLILAATAAAQQAQPPKIVGQPTPPLNVPSAPMDPALAQLLQQWEQRMKSIQGIQATVVRSETDAVTNAKDVFEGTAKFLRPDRADLIPRADLYLKKQGNPQVYERFLLTGTYLYEFRPQQKVVRVHALPQRAPGQPAVDDNFMGLMFGMSQQEAQRRYDLKLMPKPGDEWYYYLLVKPKLPADRAEFTEARLVLIQPSKPNGLLPKQISFIQPNGNPITWDIQMIDTAPRLGPADFAKPQLPRDWQTIMVPPPGTAPAAAAPPSGPAPTKVRPSGGN